MTIKQDLASIKKEIRAIDKRLNKLLKEVEKDRKAKAEKPSKAKAVKALPKNAPSKKITATDQVLNIVNRSKKGVDTATLMKKTGFDRRKVTNILQRTYKLGIIKRAGKGIYVGAK